MVRRIVILTLLVLMLVALYVQPALATVVSVR